MSVIRAEAADPRRVRKDPDALAAAPPLPWIMLAVEAFRPQFERLPSRGPRDKRDEGG